MLDAARRGLAPGASPPLDFAIADRGNEGRGPLEWGVYLKGTSKVDVSWAGDAHGRHVLRTRDDTPAPPPGEHGPVSPPTGLSSQSLLRSANMAKGLAAVRAAEAGDSRVMELTVSPARFTILVQQGSRRRAYQVDATFRAQRDDTVETDTPGLPLARVETAGPARAKETLSARGGEYANATLTGATLALPSGDRPTTWSLTLKEADGKTAYVTATLDGRPIRPGPDLGG